MGVFSSFLARRKTFQPTDRIYEAVQGFAKTGDFVDADVAQRAQVSAIAASATATAGTLDIRFVGTFAAGGALDETATVNFDDTVGEIQTAVDAALANVGYTAGDAHVTGTVVAGFGITFAVTSFHAVTVTADSSLTDVAVAPIADPAVSTTVAYDGSHSEGWAILRGLGVLSFVGRPLVNSVEPFVGTKGPNYTNVKTDIVQAIAREIAEVDQDGKLYKKIMRSLGYQA